MYAFLCNCLDTIGIVKNVYELMLFSFNELYLIIIVLADCNLKNK